MSVVVRMEMPKACWSCGLRFVCKAANDFLTTKEAGCSVLKVGMPGCLIVCQLPEGHGRLGDLDALTRLMLEHKRPLVGADSSKDRYRYMQWLADFNAIKDAKTVVPAERSETEQV